MNDGYRMIHEETMAHYGFGPEAMKKLKVCVICGTSAEAEQHFCKSCGASLPDTTLFDLYKRNHRHCESCGTIVADSMQYCPRCGKKIGG